MPDVLGYKRCVQVGCENVLLNEVSYATAGLCSACWLSLPSEERKTVEVLIERRTAKVSTHHKRTAANRHREARRRASPTSRAKKVAKVEAKRAAARRIALKYRAEYLEILAHERAKRGLEPWPAVLALEYAKATGTTISGAEVYAAGDAEAQDVDAAS
jgi:hypothetical protein